MEIKEQLSMLKDRVKAAEALVEVLRELVKSKDQTIEALKTQPQIQYIPIIQPQYPQIPYYQNPPNLQPPYIITCQHEYPSMWGGTGPASCVKCGQPSAPNTFTVTAGAFSGDTNANTTTSSKVGVGGVVGMTFTNNASRAELN